MATPNPAKKSVPKPSNSSTREKTPRRRNCKYYKLGTCRRDKDCVYRHVVKLDHVFTDYVEVPKKLPMGLAMGRGNDNLKQIKEKFDLIVEPDRSDGDHSHRVKVTTANKKQFLLVKQKLLAIFTQIDPVCGLSLCYLSGVDEIISRKLFLEFKEYQGRTPGKLVRGKQYEVCCYATHMQADDITDSSIWKELKKQEEESVHLAASSELSLYQASEAPMVPSATIRIMKDSDSREDVRQRLQSVFESILKNHDQLPNHNVMFKLEARFGKVLRFHLAEDVLDDQPWGVDTLAQFLREDVQYRQRFTTDVNKKCVEEMCADLKGISNSTPMFETIDLKFTDKDNKFDLRLKAEGKELAVLLFKRNETKVALFDFSCLHRQHDIRLSLNRFEILPPTDKLVTNLLSELKFEAGTLTLVPYTDEWSIELIRHKKRTSYVIDQKYIVSVTVIHEHRVDLEISPRKPISVEFEGIATEHTEVAFCNIMWECTFGKDVGFTPEKALALHAEHPAVAPQLAASIPHPWGVQDILQDYNEFLDYLDQLNESLGMI